MEPKTHKLYFNDVQQDVLYTGAHTTVLVMGRRGGKTFRVQAPALLRNVQQMPGSCGAIVGQSYKKILMNTLPGMIHGLREMNIFRDIHYTIGRYPTKAMNFEEPKLKPETPEHAIFWWNGSVTLLISQDGVGSANSMTLDYLMIDEAKFINFEKLKDEVLPANGGYRGDFPDCPWHHSILITSDMPQSSHGTWFLSYETDEMHELILVLHGAICELWRLKQKEETPYTKRIIRELRQKIKALQSVAVYYREASTIENLQVVGKKYVRNMKRDLRPQVFRTSILCQKPGRVKDGFYPSFARKVHCYLANDNDYLTGLEYDFGAIKKMDSRHDTDVRQDEPLCIACDYNNNISTLVVGQREGIQAMIPKSFFTKEHRKLREVVSDFGEYYRKHRNRTVVYYFNQTAKGNKYGASENVSFAEIVVDELHKKGFYVVQKDMMAAMPHDRKYTLLNDCFTGRGALLPRINEENNPDLIISIEKAEVRQSRRGTWEKDKSKEKKPENEEDLLQHRTDFSDAFDDLIIGMVTMPFYGGATQGTRFPGR